MHSSRLMAWALFCFCLVSSGCSENLDLPRAYPVTGKVMVQGAPLSGYLVSFVATDGKSGASASVGTVGTDGAYSLETLDGRPGCQPGKYKVVILPGKDAIQAAMKNMKPGLKASPKVESKVPDAYGTAKTSPKEVEVKAESNVIDISI